MSSLVMYCCHKDNSAQNKEMNKKKRNTEDVGRQTKNDRPGFRERKTGKGGKLSLPRYLWSDRQVNSGGYFPNGQHNISL